MSSLDELFAPEGALARAMPGYRRRSEQVEMAKAIAQAIETTGVLTMHGTSKSVTFTLTGQRTGVGIQVTGQIPITFADWNIPNPSFGPVTTQDHGVLEFLLVFKRA